MTTGRYILYLNHSLISNCAYQTTGVGGCLQLLHQTSSKYLLSARDSDEASKKLCWAVNGYGPNQAHSPMVRMVRLILRDWTTKSYFVQ